jgi:PPOX class probable F420-dependent enzyme
MAGMSKEAQQAFLSETQIGVLTMLSESGAPVAIPLWFEWDGERARMFTAVTSPKVRRLERDPRVSLLVARPAGEKEEWVAIDGTVEIHTDGAFELAERLAQRYWDMDDPGHRTTLELWQKAAAALRRLELVPTRIRSHVD